MSTQQPPPFHCMGTPNMGVTVTNGEAMNSGKAESSGTQPVRASDSHYYNFVSDGFQKLCSASNIVPCLLDAAIFVSYDSKKSTGGTMTSVFDKHPDHWGLRGDPSLWAELQTHFNSNEMPSSDSEFRAQLETIIQQLTGFDLDSDDAVCVPRYDAGGMSSGHVSPEFWREIAIPLLCERFGKTVE